MTKITRKNAVNLYRELWGVSKLHGSKFAYAVARNIKLLEPTVNELKVAYPDEDFIKYDQARADLAQAHAIKDENGKPKTNNVNGAEIYDIADKEAFDKEYETLRNANLDVIAKREAQEVVFNKLKDEEVEVDLYLMFRDQLPDDITAEQVIKILPVIQSDDEAK